MKEDRLAVHPPRRMVSLTASSSWFSFRTPCSAPWNAPGKARHKHRLSSGYMQHGNWIYRITFVRCALKNITSCFYFCNIIILQLKEALEQVCHAELVTCALSISAFQPCKTWDSQLSGKGKMKRKEDGHHESGDQRLEDPPADTLMGRVCKPCQVNRPGSCCRRPAYLMCLWTQQVWAVGTSWLGCPSPGWYVLQQGHRKRDKMQSWVFAR